MGKTMPMTGMTRMVAMIAALAVVLPATAGPTQAQAPGAAMITAAEYDVMAGQSQWLSQLVSRLQRRGRSLDAEQQRELALIQGEITRMKRVRDTVGDTRDNARSGILRKDAEDLLDRMSALWVSLRRAEGLVAAAETAPVPTPAPAPTVHTLPPGARAQVRLTTWISSKNAVVGDRFSALAVEAIYVDGQVAVPTGAVFEGLVTSVDRAGRGSDAGEITLYIDRLRGDQGQMTDTRGLVVGLSSGDNISAQGVDVGRTAAVGAVAGVIGGLLGGVKGAVVGATVGAGGAILAEKGNEVDLPQGTVLRVEFQAPVTVTWSWRPAS